MEPTEPYLVLHRPISPSWHGPSAFTLLPSGELWETIDFVIDVKTDEVVPDWSNGYLRDLEMSPLHLHIHAALHLIQEG